MAGYIFDTNIFNRIADGDVDAVAISAAANLYATHIELNELQRTRKDERREQLLRVFDAIGPKRIPTESAVWGVSEWGGSKWTAEDNLYQPIVEALNAENGGKPNNTHDALIAEAAIRNGLALVTEDTDLAKVAKKHGGVVIDLRQLLEELKIGIGSA